jgi:hypothetical protein
VAKRARHDLPAIQERRAEVVRLRGEGKAWDKIAQLTGFSNGSAASKAWRAAIQQRPDLTVDEIRRAERGRLEVMDSRLAQIISRPPGRTTSIGRTQFDVRTCTCDVKADTKREHEPGCKVQPVLDEHAVIAAHQRTPPSRQGLRRLTGADLTRLQNAGLNQDQVRAMAEVIVAQRDRTQQAPLQLAPLPDSYHALTPEQQARLQIERQPGGLRARSGSRCHSVRGYGILALMNNRSLPHPPLCVGRPAPSGRS